MEAVRRLVEIVTERSQKSTDLAKIEEAIVMTG